jgi:hypothetical protein
MDHIGIDVHKKDIQICILTEAGELVERRVRMEASRFAEVLGARPRALGAYPDERIEAVPRTDSRVRLLRSMPSVGPVTAAAFVSAFDDPAPAHPRRRGPTFEGEAVLLPVEVLPEAVDAVDDAVELVAAVGVGGPQLVERAKLREIAEPVLGRLGHRHLPGHEAAVALTRVDPECLRCLFGEEDGRLVGRHRAQEEEAGGEADRATLRSA